MATSTKSRSLATFKGQRTNSQTSEDIPKNQKDRQSYLVAQNQQRYRKTQYKVHPLSNAQPQ